MALNGKYVSIGRVIEEVYGDNKYDFSIEFDDVLRWAGSVLKILKHPDLFIKKVTGHVDNPNLDITNYRAKLPCDLLRIEQIAVNGSPAIYAGGTFHPLLSGACCGITESSGTGDLFVDNFGNTFDNSLGTPIQGGLVSYTVNDDYLTLSVQEGTVCIAYLAFPTDNDGFPMIPEEESVIQAVKYYITMMLDRLAWRLDPNNSGKKAIYDKSEQDYAWYIGKASSDAKMPDYERAEALKNQLLRLRPRVNEHSTFYKFLGAPNTRYVL